MRNVFKLYIRNSKALFFIHEITESLGEIMSVSVTFSPKNDFRPGFLKNHKPALSKPHTLRKCSQPKSLSPAPSPVFIPVSPP